MCIRDREKGQDILIAAARNLPNVNFILAGEGPLLGELRQACLLYTSDAADERSSVDLGGRRIIKK